MDTRASQVDPDDRPDYRLVARQIESLAREDPHWVPLLANASALLMEEAPDLNWAGFYLVRRGADGGERLVLGPFQGRVACVTIMPGRGVCGTAMREDATQLVRDVHQFPGHIACDGASRSEVVVPIHAGGPRGPLVGVLDVDSPHLARFSGSDVSGLEAVASTIGRVCDFSDPRA